MSFMGGGGLRLGDSGLGLSQGVGTIDGGVLSREGGDPDSLGGVTQGGDGTIEGDGIAAGVGGLDGLKDHAVAEVIEFLGVGADSGGEVGGLGVGRGVGVVGVVHVVLVGTSPP